MKDLLVYVNIPFCTSKCPFCDWVTHIPPSDLMLKPANSRRRRYIEALATQIETLGPRLSEDGYVPKIVYFGGGTGTILTEDELAHVMRALRQSFDLDGVDEATLEGSPETITLAKLRVARELGFNRVSVGIQSMDDDRLKRLARRHDSAEAAASLERARQAGFTDVSIDLISGFPGETLDEFMASLEKVLSLPFDHVSLYPYRPAAGTGTRRHLRNGWSEKIDLDEQIVAYQAAASALTRAGYDEYCFGHFGFPRSRSDLAYFGVEMDWVGFGSGASSLFDQRIRETTQGELDRYIARPTEFDVVSDAREPMVTRHLLYQALTTPEGAVASRWEARTGGTLDDALRQAPAVELVRYLTEEAGVIRDRDGIRVQRERIAPAYIKLLYLNAPQIARQRREPRVLTGGS